MIKREDLLKSPEYWFVNAQSDLYGLVATYMEKEGINQSQLAERLGCTKGYVSQILRGEFNYTLKKLIELALAIGMVPKITYKSLDSVIDAEKAPFRKVSGNSGQLRDRSLVNTTKRKRRKQNS